MEPTEIHEFTEQMKEAGEPGREPLTHISLAISILAVLVAMVTVQGHRTHTRAIIEQTRAADLWNWYQAKKIRLESLTVTADILALQPTTDPAALNSRISGYRSQIKKWQADLDEEEHQATELEAEVNLAEKQAARYDLGEALLQVGVVLSSVTLFTRNRAYYFVGILLGLAGLLTASSGLFLHSN
jgi:hypothetical protein